MVKIIKHIIVFQILMFSIVNICQSQNLNNSLIFNKWSGQLDVGNNHILTLVFKFWIENDTVKASMDSPNQGAMGIKADSVRIKDKSVFLSINKLKIIFTGSFNETDSSINGTFSQGNFNKEMTLKAFKLNRPQEPKKPYPYKEIAVKINNADVTLAGTITMPEGTGPFPAVVLISGSGPEDRNEELFNHKPFLIIADYLTRNGFAVLRSDDRGTAQSTGNYKTATMNDFASDAYTAFSFLKSFPGVNPAKVGLIGHSEGGMIVPLLASQHPEIAFIVMMAGPGVRGDQLLLLQAELIYRQSKVPEDAILFDKETKQKAFAVIIAEKDTAKIRAKIRKIYLNADEEKMQKLGINKSQIELIVKQFTSNELMSIIRYDPCPELKKVKCPVLAINGDKDLQVPSKQNLKAIQTCLTEGGNTNVTIKELYYLNHMFQSATTGAISEYYEIEETVSPIALETMGDWLKEIVIK
jgi:uncharacterized protein